MINRTPGKVFEGELNAKGLRIGIVCSRFNEFFVGKLLDGAMDAFVRHGGDAADVEVAWVPGSFELPFAVSRMLARGGYDAVIALGCVIQGATTHAAQINNQVSKGLGHSRHLRSADHRKYRAGDRTQRHQGRKPRFRRHRLRHRNGKPELCIEEIRVFR